MNVSIPSDSILSKRGGKQIFLSLICYFFLQTSAISISAQNGYYHLITASFKTFEAASTHVKGLESDKDYSPVILMPTENSSFYRVSIYQSFDRKKVLAYNKMLKGKSKKSGWVFAQVEPVADNATARSSGNSNASSVPTDGTIYHLIVGSFNTFNQAFSEQKKREEKGFEPYILNPDPSNSNYRVAVYYSENRKEVERYASLLKRRGENGGWIFEDGGGAKTSVKTADVSTEVSRVANVTEVQADESQNNTYHLIGGSFKRFDQASNLAEALKKKGIDPLIMWPEKDGGYFKVSVYRSTNKQEVKAYEEAARKNGIVNGWVFAQKN